MIFEIGVPSDSMQRLTQTLVNQPGWAGFSKSAVKLLTLALGIKGTPYPT